MASANGQVRPFLKWAGGKRWFTRKCGHTFPASYKRYIEPFLGSGAVFFHLRPETALLGDKNQELIDAYLAIKEDWKRVWEKLQRHQRLHSKGHYYKTRGSRPRSPSGWAARLIYLNRTCFNGLYRVNLKGEFNVPKGTKDTVVFPDDDFSAIAEVLKGVTLLTDDFEAITAQAGEGDLLYVDPPYTVRHNNNNFLKYNETIFSWSDQVRLCAALQQASARGAKIVMSNADNHCIRKLYKERGHFRRVSRHSVLAADPTKRRKTTELVVTNFAIEEFGERDR